MSINATYIGNLQAPGFVALSGATSTKVGDTASDSTVVAASWAFDNTTGGTVTCSLIWYNGSIEQEVWRKAIVTNDTAVESNIPIRLASGHEIRAKAASGVNVTVVFLQMLRNT